LDALETFDDVLPEAEDVAQNTEVEQDVEAQLASQVADRLGGISLPTSQNAAVFWSGIEGSDTAAAEWAAKNGGTTLEQALGSQGITLPAWNASDPTVVDAWSKAAEEFANGASGDVTVLQEESVRVNSIWAQVEYPALTSNPSVMSITAVDPQTGAHTLLWSR
jgi:filamentous hemagglutinin